MIDICNLIVGGPNCKICLCIFSVHPVMTTRPDSYVPPPNADMLHMNNLRIHRAIVLAVHDTGSSPSVLHAVMGPKHYERLLHKEWKVKGCDFMDPLSTNDTVYFCVPIAEEEHLYLEDCAMKYIIIQLYD